MIQINTERAHHLKSKGISIFEIGEVNESDIVKIQLESDRFDFYIPTYRKHWMTTSYLMDNHQTVPELFDDCPSNKRLSSNVFDRWGYRNQSDHFPTEF